MAANSNIADYYQRLKKITREDFRQYGNRQEVIGLIPALIEVAHDFAANYSQQTTS